MGGDKKIFIIFARGCKLWNLKVFQVNKDECSNTHKCS